MCRRLTANSPKFPVLSLFNREFGVETGSLETGPSGTSLIQDLLKNGLNAVTPYKPSGDKIMRMHAQTGLIENGFVFLPTEAPWLPEYLHEMTVFPNGRYDDQSRLDRAVLGLVQNTNEVCGYLRALSNAMGRVAAAAAS